EQDHRAIAPDRASAVGSEPMEITAGGLDRGTAAPLDRDPTADVIPATGVDERGESLALRDRLRQPRTIVSILVPLVVIAAFAALNGSQLAKVPGLIGGADVRLVAVAFVIFYAGFPMRGLRWAMLLRGTGIQVSVRDSSEIIFLSW